MTRVAHCLLLLAIAGCTERIDLASSPLDAVIAVELTPADAMVRITDLTLPRHTLQYQAMGRFEDGTSRDVTEHVTWTVDNQLLGSFDVVQRGVFLASQRAAGRGIVKAELQDLTASVALTVMIDASIVDTAFPPPAAGLFDPSRPVVSDDPTRSPAVIYPTSGAVIPAGVARTLYQLAPGANNDAYRLSFDSDVLHLVVETGADRWEANGAIQDLLAHTGLAGPINVSVRATSSVGTTVYAGNAISQGYSPDTPGGPLYYWSAATNGIMRGGIDAVSAGSLYPGSGTACVGCHAVSRDGNTMAMGYENGASFDLHAIDIGTLQTRIATSPARPMGFASFSPDGKRIVVANKGTLTEYDAQTGSELVAVPLPSSRYASHPDWAPDGTSVVVALTSQPPNNLDIKAASIARIPYSGGTWGTPEILVTGSATNNNYFPKWSPDGKHLVYVRASTGSQAATSAELVLFEVASRTSRPLTAANRRVGTSELTNIANTMPAWGPRVGERMWLAFVSARPYGSVLPAGRGQLWITSIDLTSTQDPSTPAFWVPCQDVTVLNNNPVWSGEGPTITL